MWLANLAVLTVVTTQVLGGIVTDFHHARNTIRGEDALGVVASRWAESSDMAAIQKRQMVSAFNTTTWNTQTSAACVSNLEALNGVASNPAGLALCYNVVNMDSTNGTFYADMRIYMVAPPSGQFAGVPAQNVKVAAMYTGAVVSSVKPAAMAMKKRTEMSFNMESWPAVKRDVSGKRMVMIPTLVQSYGIVGKIDMTGVTALTTPAQMEALLTPYVTLTAVDTTNKQIQTSLSAKEASFIQGAFAVSAVQATMGGNLPTVNQTGIAAVVNAPGVLFRTPGTQILIPPIGAVITGTWVVLMLLTIGYGTIGRIGFRDQFRRKSGAAREKKINRL